MTQRILSIVLILFLVACSSTKTNITNSTENVLNSRFYDNQFTGLMVFNPKNQDTLLNINGKRYFTPASNTKIVTLFTSICLLSDSIPTLKYQFVNDTLYVEGKGDPSQLHPYYNDSTGLKFLNKYKNIAIHYNNFHDSKLGPGWSWDDYYFAYQVEKSSLPLYGNLVKVSNSEGLHVIPNYFQDSVFRVKSSVNRVLEANMFYYPPLSKDSLNIPYITSDKLNKQLLERALEKSVSIAEKMPDGRSNILYSLPTDSLLKRMMHQSDNFLAEQLLLLASSSLSDSLNGKIAQEYMLENQLTDLAQQPRWVDGSGLSRYNLFSPESIVHILYKLYKELPREKLFRYFPAGGAKGSTLEEWYVGNPNPYIYAKTGSLGNNHNLSGYLITKSGETLIFSFMNNHFRVPSSEVKQKMQAILEEIRDGY